VGSGVCGCRTMASTISEAKENYQCVFYPIERMMVSVTMPEPCGGEREEIGRGPGVGSALPGRTQLFSQSCRPAMRCLLRVPSVQLRDADAVGHTSTEGGVKSSSVAWRQVGHYGREPVPALGGARVSLANC